MRVEAGGVVVLVGECQPDEALLAASRWIPRGWHVEASKTPWGAALIGGPAVSREDHFVVVGTAVADPWGVPGVELDSDVLLDRFTRYGDHVSQLAAGPFAVADLRRASLIAALNGIVPVFLGRGARVAVGNHKEMVAALAGSTSSVPVPPGSSASVDGNVTNVAWFGVYESLPMMSLHHLDAEVESHIRAAGPSRRVGNAMFGDAFRQLNLRWIGSALVASPRFRSIRDRLQAPAELQAIRGVVSDLWWRAGLRNASLFVPAFERPALDSLTLAVRASS